jgi:hypothetical protein
VRIKAHYGCPDYIFLGHVDEDALGSAAELRDPHFVDVRDLYPGDLSAGHDVIALWYRTMVLDNLTRLPAGALRNFGQERLGFARGDATR